MFNNINSNIIHRIIIFIFLNMTNIYLVFDKIKLTLQIIIKMKLD